MKRIVMLGLRMTEAERTAAVITARRKGTSTGDFVRSLLSEDQLFRRELARVRRESASGASEQESLCSTG